MKYEVRHNANAEFGFVWEIVKVDTGEVFKACREDDKKIADHIAKVMNA